MGLLKEAIRVSHALSPAVFFQARWISSVFASSLNNLKVLVRYSKSTPDSACRAQLLFEGSNRRYGNNKQQCPPYLYATTQHLRASSSRCAAHTTSQAPAPGSTSPSDKAPVTRLVIRQKLESRGSMSQRRTEITELKIGEGETAYILTLLAFHECNPARNIDWS